MSHPSSTKQYRKKPVVVEALQWTGDNLESLRAFVPEEWRHNKITEPMGIVTPEGVMEIKVGDWIIKGVKGEFYPCRPDIFELTYEQVERDSEKTRPSEPTLPEGFKNKIYRIIDSFLVESKNQYGEDRSLDRLNQDRHLAANELLDLFASAVREAEMGVARDIYSLSKPNAKNNNTPYVIKSKINRKLRRYLPQKGAEHE